MGRTGRGVDGHSRIGLAQPRAAAAWLLCTAALLSANAQQPPQGPPITSQTVFNEDECPRSLPDADIDAIFEIPEDGAAQVFRLDYALTFRSELEAGFRTIEVRCPAQKGIVEVVSNTQNPGMIRYTPNAGAFGCDLFSYEVALVEQEDDQRYPEVTRVMITIVSQNDPPSNPPDIFYYNPPYMRTLMPNTGEAEGLDMLFYPYEGVSAQRMRLPLPPDNGYDDDLELISYELVNLPSNGTLWIEDREGNFICWGQAWLDRRCSVEGTNNIFSYLPRANLENFRDSFRYSTHDCKLPRAVHQSTGQACFAPRFTTLHFETGAFQGTGGLVQQRLRSPRTVYTTDAPLETEEDTPVLGYLQHNPDSREDGSVNNNAVPNDLMYTISFPVKHGKLDLLCEGRMVSMWAAFEMNDTTCDRSAVTLDDELVTAARGELGVFRYEPDPDYNGDDSFRFATRSASFNGGSSGSTTAANAIRIVPVDDPPNITDGLTQIPMSERNDPLPNIGFVTVFAEDKDSPQLYVRMTAPFRHGKLYLSTVATGNGSAVIVPVYSSLVEVNQVMAMNLPNATARSNTFTLTLNYVADRMETYGDPFDSATFEVADNAAFQARGVSNQREVELQVQCGRGFYMSTVKARLPDGMYHGQCSSCPEGTFSNAIGAAECTPCEPGSFSLGSSPLCELCDLDTYQNETRKTKCEPCPQNRNTQRGRTAITLDVGSPDVADCICQRADQESAWGDEARRGFYGPAGQSCYECPGPDPKDGFEGYLGQEEWVKCETDGIRFPVSQFGFFTDIKVLPVVIRDCIPREACPTHETEAAMLQQPCKPGYKGHGCSQCADDYTRFFGKCNKCSGASVGMFLAGLFGYSAFYIGVTALISASIKSFPQVSICLAYAQMVGLAGSLQLNYPPMLEGMLKALTFVNVSPELLAPECAFGNNVWTYASNWLLVMSAPIMYLGWILFSTGALLLHNEYIKRHGKSFRARYPALFQRVRGPPGSYERLTGIAKVYLGLFLTHTRDRRAILSAFRAQVHRLLTFLNLAYTFLVLKLFEYVQCADNVDGNSYLAVEPSVQCYQFHDAYIWGRLFPPALAATVFYVIGIPVVIGYLLLSLRHNKSGPGPVALLGSIYGRYDHMWYMWELQNLLLKFIMASTLLWFSSISRINQLRQAVFMMTFTLFSMIFHSYASPYDSWALNQYQTICLLCIFFLVFGGLICSGDISEDLRDKFDAVLIAFTSIPFCLLAIVSMDYVMALLQTVYDVNVTQVKKLRMEAEMRESMKDKMTLAMNLRIAKKNKAFKLQETDSQKILTKNGHRITEELWYEARVDPTILIPTREEMEPLFSALFDDLDDSTTLDLVGHEAEEKFDAALRQRGMVFETLAQNKVEDNLEIKATIEKILEWEAPRGPIDILMDVVRSFLKRFDQERMRAGSTYTQIQTKKNKAQSRSFRRQRSLSKSESRRSEPLN